MVGIEFVENQISKTPATAYVLRLKNECLRRGLVLISAGTYSHVIRFLVPLVIDDRTLQQGLGILESVLMESGDEFRAQIPETTALDGFPQVVL